MNVVHTVAPGDFGGLEEVVGRLARGFLRRGHRVSVVGVVNAPGDAGHFFGTLRDGGVEAHKVVVSGRSYGREISEVRALLERLAPDVVHTHGYRADVVHAVAARRASLPLVSTLHGFTGGGLRNRLYEWLQVRSVRRHQAVVAVSAPMAVALRRRGVPDKILHVIPNAWESRSSPDPRPVARATLGARDGDIVVGWVGRLSHEKGPDLFLEGLARVRDPRLAAAVLGDGPLRLELESKARQLGLDRVRFHGPVPDAYRLFSGFDAFVLSSRTEGTPIALFEAMDAEVPIIATAVGGVPDVVSPGSALLVPPEDPDAVASAVRTLLDDPAAADERAAAAREVLRDRFAADPWLGKYERLYESARS